MNRKIIAAALIAVIATGIAAQEKPASRPETMPEKKSEKDEAVKGKVVYKQDFEKAVGPEWSSNLLSFTWAGRRRFLGQFAKDSVTLKLDKLPAHKYIRLSLDLYAIQSWDGNDTTCPVGNVIGPDTWTLTVDDAPPLIDASIALNDEYKAKQSYPDTYCFASHPASTAAAEKATLGYGFGSRMSGMDAVYHIDVVIPHTAAAVQFAFAGTRQIWQKLDESWGLDNVEVTVYEQSPVGKLSVEKLKTLFGHLSSDDPAKADKALWTLAAAENADDVVKLFRGGLENIKPKRLEVPDDVAALLKKLDDDDWKEREKATKALKDMGEKIIPILRQTLEETKSTEVRTRIRHILDQDNVSGKADSDLLVASRMVRVLQIIGTDEAKASIKDMVKQYPDLAKITAETAKTKKRSKEEGMFRPGPPMPIIRN